MKYITPTFYRQSGQGIDLAGMGDAELGRVIALAEQEVDRRCHLPTLLPTSVVDEVHDWNPDSRRVYYRLHPMPLTTVDTFKIQVGVNTLGAPVVATVGAGDMVTQPVAGWVELVYLATANVMGLLQPLAEYGLMKPQALLSYHAGWSFTSDSEPLLDSGDRRIYQGARPWWDSAVAPVVVVDGVTQTSGYSVNFREGTVTFDATQSPTADVLASYTYHLPDPVRQATTLLTTMYLGERALAIAGMTGLTTARSGQIFQAERPKGTGDAQVSQRVKDLLADYTHRSLRGRV